MEIRERIESCLNDLEQRRRQMVEFEARVRALVNTLNEKGGTPGTLSEVLDVLTGVLQNYNDIDSSCRQMVRALVEIGQHQDRIEDGRKRIISGVERILSRLSQMEALAKQSLGQSQPRRSGERRRSTKRVLLIRLRPEPAKSDEVKLGPAEPEEDLLEEDLDPGDDRDTTVH